MAETHSTAEGHNSDGKPQNVATPTKTNTEKSEAVQCLLLMLHDEHRPRVAVVQVDATNMEETHSRRREAHQSDGKAQNVATHRKRTRAQKNQELYSA